jgi:hypothetical protein
MARMDTRGKRDHANYRPHSSDFGFLVGAAILATGLILLSVALGVGVAPEVSMFAAP